MPWTLASYARSPPWATPPMIATGNGARSRPVSPEPAARCTRDPVPPARAGPPARVQVSTRQGRPVARVGDEARSIERHNVYRGDGRRPDRVTVRAVGGASGDPAPTGRHGLPP